MNSCMDFAARSWKRECLEWALNRGVQGLLREKKTGVNERGNPLICVAIMVEFSTKAWAFGRVSGLRPGRLLLRNGMREAGGRRFPRR